jgi:PKD repeat protein
VEWDFGDGKKSKEFFLERSFGAPGRYPITLTVTDKMKQTTSRTLYAVVE